MFVHVLIVVLEMFTFVHVLIVVVDFIVYQCKEYSGSRIAAQYSKSSIKHRIFGLESWDVILEVKAGK